MSIGGAIVAALAFGAAIDPTVFNGRIGVWLGGKLRRLFPFLPK